MEKMGKNGGFWGYFWGGFWEVFFVENAEDYWEFQHSESGKSRDKKKSGKKWVFSKK